MRGEGIGDVASAGLRLRQKIAWAVGLATALTAVALVFVFPAPRLAVFLLAAAFLLMIRSAYLTWGVATGLARLGQMLSGGEAVVPAKYDQDEFSVVLQTVAKMLETIEQQANEINGFASRLDTAYQELDKTNTRLTEAAFKDYVTGLYNRSFFCIRLEEEIQRHRQLNHSVCVVLMDLDGFKAIVDDVGRPAAEDILRDVAEILVRHTQRVAVVCRFEGELFAVLLVETSLADGREYANRLWQVLQAHPQFDNISPWFGIASLSEGDADTAALFERADEDLRRNRCR